MTNISDHHVVCFQCMQTLCILLCGSSVTCDEDNPKALLQVGSTQLCVQYYEAEADVRFTAQFLLKLGKAELSEASDWKPKR